MTKLLIIDDDANIRDSLQLVLETEGYDVVTAFDGQDALNAIDESIELILLDLTMPIMNGYEFHDELKKGPYNQVPVIVMTGLEESKPIKGSTVIKKPISLPILMKAIKDTYLRKIAKVS